MGLIPTSGKYLTCHHLEFIETVAAKQQVFKTAVEASTMILNIDDEPVEYCTPIAKKSSK